MEYHNHFFERKKFIFKLTSNLNHQLKDYRIEVGLKKMKVNDFNILENLYYTKDHEWALNEKQDVIRVGITDYAQRTLHEIVFVGLPKKVQK